jgi:membrane-associated protein
MPELVQQLLDSFRYWHSDAGIRAIIEWGGLSVLIAIVFAETGLLLGFFLPGDSLLVTAGVVCAREFAGLPQLDIWTTYGLLLLAAVIGDQVGFLLGRKTGHAIFQREDSRFFKRRYAEEAHAFYLKKGGRAIVIARFVPIMRTFVPFIAGVADMPYRNFVYYNVVGGVLWVTSMLWLGYFLGQSPLVSRIHHIILLVIAVSLIPLAYEVFKRVRPIGRRSTAPAHASSPTREETGR